MTVAPQLTDSHASTGAPRSRALALAAVMLLAIFAAGLLAGFVYAHEPSAPELRTRLQSPAATPSTTLRGTISSVATEAIEVSTTDGTRHLPVAPGTHVEDLTPLSGSVPEGASANVGGNRTESGFVITGVVVLPDRTP